MDTIPVPSLCVYCNQPLTLKHTIYISGSSTTTTSSSTLSTPQLTLYCNIKQPRSTPKTCVICNKPYIIVIKVLHNRLFYGFTSCSVQHTQRILKYYNIIRYLSLYTKQHNQLPKKTSSINIANICIGCKKLATKTDHGYVNVTTAIDLVDTSNEQIYVKRTIHFLCATCNLKRPQDFDQHCFYCSRSCTTTMPTSLSTLTIPLCSNSCYTNTLPILRDALQYLNLESLVMTSCMMCSTPNVSLKCSTCLSTYYCSRVCQVLHWNEHKLICKRTTT